MVVSILRFTLELPGVASLKEKRQIVQSIKHRIQNKFKITVAEVDLQDSLGFAEIGAAIVSNSRSFGESVLNKALHLAEGHVGGRLRDPEIFSEFY
jgi:uncharacterized protein YlxP (DUF503 family)